MDKIQIVLLALYVTDVLGSAEPDLVVTWNLKKFNASHWYFYRLGWNHGELLLTFDDVLHDNLVFILAHYKRLQLVGGNERFYITFQKKNYDDYDWCMFDLASLEHRVKSSLRSSGEERRYGFNGKETMGIGI